MRTALRFAAAISNLLFNHIFDIWMLCEKYQCYELIYINLFFPAYSQKMDTIELSRLLMLHCDLQETFAVMLLLTVLANPVRSDKAS